MLIFSIAIASRSSSQIRLTIDTKVGNDRNKLHNNTLKNINIIENCYMINFTINDITERLLIENGKYKIHHKIDKFIAYVVLNGLIYYMMLVIYHCFLKFIELRRDFAEIRLLNYTY